jgi:cytochrome c553
MYKILFFSLTIFCLSCNREFFYATNGETIYRTGKNKEGVALLDKKLSKITLFKSCQSCHGRDGSRFTNIQYKALTNKKVYKKPYTDELINRFLDNDLKSDSTKVRSGVAFRMSEQDKKDLIDFLKTLK